MSLPGGPPPSPGGPRSQTSVLIAAGYGRRAMRCIHNSAVAMRNRGAAPVLGVDVPPKGPSACIRAAIAAALCAALLACLAATSAAAAPTLSWRASRIDTSALTGVSCASNALCVAVDGEGDAVIGTNPAGSASWNRVALAGASALTGVSCASGALCAAVDKDGDVFLSTNPGLAKPTSWSPPVEIDKGGSLSSISCPTTSLCVAVDGSSGGSGSGSAFLSTDPTAGAASNWSRIEIDKGNALSSVSCAVDLPCVAVDSAGQALTRSDSGVWHPRPLDVLGLAAISCSAAPISVCVAMDEAGDALASANIAAAGPPSGPGPTWSTTPIETLTGPDMAEGVSCAAAGLCAFVDGGGGAYVSDDPTAAAPSWTFSAIDPGTPLTGVSCTSEGLCATVSGVGAGAGQVFVATTPPPSAAEPSASAIAETSATLTAAVDPEDAALTACHFEYGPSTAYEKSAPCNIPLPAGGTSGAVSATVSALTAHTTYHYRLVLATASGTESTLDATFTTTAPPLVQPHPSIGGIPALGQHLTCKSGVSSGGATLAYAWLRDTKAIAGASGTSYLVGSADVSHHLQCRVTATNAAGSASATSAFVTVPAGGLGSISETKVGAVHVSGSTVSVPLTCSAQAAGSCSIALRLTVVETLRGGRVIAVAASRTRHATVTVGASTAHLPAGAQRTVAVALNTTGRHLLARLHKLTAKLSVSGTVVGALSAQLKSATVTLGAAGKASSRHRR